MDLLDCLAPAVDWALAAPRRNPGRTILLIAIGTAAALVVLFLAVFRG